MTDIPCSSVGGFNIVDIHSPQIDSQIQHNPNENPTSHTAEINQLILKCMCRCKEPIIYKVKVKKDTLEGINYSISRVTRTLQKSRQFDTIVYSTYSIYKYKEIDQWTRIESQK